MPKLATFLYYLFVRNAFERSGNGLEGVRAFGVNVVKRHQKYLKGPVLGSKILVCELYILTLVREKDSIV